MMVPGCAMLLGIGLLSAALADGVPNETQPQAASARHDWELACDVQSWRKLPSTWPEYFGIHYSTRPGPWRTVRGYAGPHVGFPHAGRPLGQGQPVRIGPYSGQPVQVALEDIRNWKRSEEQSLSTWIPQLATDDRAAIYVTSGLFDSHGRQFPKDLAYWTMRLCYQRPQAERHIYWQWGNEINGDHFDMLTPEERAAIPGTSPWRFSNLPVKQQRYVEWYLAPGIEATRRASQDVFGDPRRIKILSGSCANSYNPRFREWFYGILDRTIEGEQAPSLKGTKVWQHLDVITIHYPFAAADRSGGGSAVLQEVFDRYVRAENPSQTHRSQPERPQEAGPPTGSGTGVKVLSPSPLRTVERTGATDVPIGFGSGSTRVTGLWVTEEHGDSAQGAVTVIDRGLQYLDWVASNGLNAEQTRLCWWGADRQKAGGAGTAAAELLGHFFAHRQLACQRQTLGSAPTYLIAGSQKGRIDRLLVAIVPTAEQALGKLTLALRASRADQAWSAQAVQWSAKKPAESWSLAVAPTSGKLIITLDRTLQGPLTLLLQPAQ